jgi:hypothetical protein
MLSRRHDRNWMGWSMQSRWVTVLGVIERIYNQLTISVHDTVHRIANNRIHGNHRFPNHFLSHQCDSISQAKTRPHQYLSDVSGRQLIHHSKLFLLLYHSTPTRPLTQLNPTTR